MPFNEKKTLSAENFRQLQWRLGERLACSVFELAVYAFAKGWRFQLPVGTLCTPEAYASIIRAGFSYCKQKQIVVAPLLLDKGHKSNGKTFPQGAFLGAEAFIDNANATLKMIGRAFGKGAKESPLSWCLPFGSLL